MVAGGFGAAGTVERRFEAGRAEEDVDVEARFGGASVDDIGGCKVEYFWAWRVAGVCGK
jgi:hypothetical protein